MATLSRGLTETMAEGGGRPLPLGEGPFVDADVIEVVRGPKLWGPMVPAVTHLGLLGTPFL